MATSGICEGCKMPAYLSDGVLCGRCDLDAPQDCCDHEYESGCKCCMNECEQCSDIDDDDYLMENS